MPEGDFEHSWFLDELPPMPVVGYHPGDFERALPFDEVLPIITDEEPVPPVLGVVARFHLWVLDDDYVHKVFLEQWIRLRYRIALNGMEDASIEFPPGYAKLSEIDIMDRLRIVRDGLIVWQGILQGEGWNVDERAPIGDTVQWTANSTADYLKWRTVPRPAGQDFDTVTDHADDIAKDLVDRHLGPSAVGARQFADVTVADDEHACASITLSLVGGVLLDHLADLAKGYAFYWRFIPLVDGAEFATAWPLWGLDRTKGNGVNEELVFSFDRRNVRRMRYWRDLNAHGNYVYVAGQGEGQDTAMSERSDAPAIAANKRREIWLQASNATTAGEREAQGDGELARRVMYEAMEVEAQPGVFTPANLGDMITVYARRYGRTFSFDAIVQAITFEIGPDGVEYATPELVAVWEGA